jgi:hypothetical protein
MASTERPSNIDFKKIHSIEMSHESKGIVTETETN